MNDWVWGREGEARESFTWDVYMCILPFSSFLSLMAIVSLDSATVAKLRAGMAPRGYFTVLTSRPYGERGGGQTTLCKLLYEHVYTS